MNKKLLITALFCAVVFVVGFITIPDIIDRAPSVGAKPTPSSNTSPSGSPTTTTSECIPNFNCPTDTNTPTPATNTTDTRDTTTTDTTAPVVDCDPSDPACVDTGGGGGVSDPCDAFGNCDPVIIDGTSDPTSEASALTALRHNATGICVNLLSCQDEVLKQKCQGADCDKGDIEADADIPLVIYDVRVIVKPTLDNDQYKAIISYNTNLPADTKMSYEKSSSPPKMFSQRSSTNSKLDKNHIVVLMVDPNSNYFFQLISKTSDKQAQSEIFAFPTPERRLGLGNLISAAVNWGN